ncbi:MAG: hypothetical protein IKF96_06055 [Eggerthellaceae bacterium]|nr:hypothetical protein [Eggerthellaceae bacterium]
MARETSLSRRRMLELTGAGMFGAAMLAGCNKADDGGADPAEPVDDGPKLIKLYDPTGNVAITQTHAPRLDTIEGKTIGLVVNDVWESDRIAAKLAELFAAKYPSVTIIGPENFTRGSEYITVDNNGIYEQATALGVDGIIVMAAG